ncbi:MAG: hypothetical protein CVU60_10170 [Deltaproteobacteria bacterium HGW-Deltaproteobacteria-18]|jgi:hypothetical protein|nr:MAG: hypothetical protein CVU60_10170 [Deltaproteobacteria bacterium HGW-Deltaproteobacteria-18]
MFWVYLRKTAFGGDMSGPVVTSGALDAKHGTAQLNHLNKSQFFIKSCNNLGKIFLKMSREALTCSVPVEIRIREVGIGLIYG